MAPPSIMKRRFFCGSPMKTLSMMIGNTRVVELSHIGNGRGPIFLKMSLLNPSGSVKDVMAAYMLDQAERKKRIRPGGKILEVTTGNTGISFAMLSSVKGYEFIAVMPEHMSIERRQMMRAFGARLVLTPRDQDMPGALRRYGELKETYPDAWLPDQFENRDNIDAHRLFTGVEIVRQVPRPVDFFVAGAGTGGTVIGAAFAIRERYPACRVVVVEPQESAVLSGGRPGLHGIQGIGEGFTPRILADNRGMIDQVIAVSTSAAMEMCRRLAQQEGILAGPSTGANLHACLQLLKDNPDACVVTLAPDRGERYLHLGLYGCSAQKCQKSADCTTLLPEEQR
jgi:cysteine synthase